MHLEPPGFPPDARRQILGERLRQVKVRRCRRPILGQSATEQVIEIGVVRLLVPSDPQQKQLQLLRTGLKVGLQDWTDSRRMNRRELDVGRPLCGRAALESDHLSKVGLCVLKTTPEPRQVGQGHHHFGSQRRLALKLGG